MGSDRTKRPGRVPPLGLRTIARELSGELRTRSRLPPGETSFNLARSLRMQRDPLTFGLESYRRYGPIYTARVFHRRVVFMLGPEANHFVTAAGADHFSWRHGMFGEQLTPLLGDGLLTTDGDHHDRARQIMMPAFHRSRMDAVVEVMVEEVTRSLDALPAGEVADVYRWIRRVATDVTMRALLGVDARDDDVGRRAAELFERALSFFGTPLPLMAARGPGSPWRRMQKARSGLDRIVYEEIARRRACDSPGDDVLSMLITARADDGSALSDRDLRDHAMTLLAAGHDTTSSTVAFLLYELARNRSVMDRIAAEGDAVLGGGAPSFEQLSNDLPELSMAVEEALRMYPPAWFGPRLSIEDFEFGGYVIPSGTHVAYSSWATQHLPDVFSDPERFSPERFAPAARAALPRGAYMPFGGGRRICIGRRFGLLLVKAAATLMLQRMRPELLPGHRLEIATVPNLSPRGGLPLLLGART